MHTLVSTFRKVLFLDKQEAPSSNNAKQFRQTSLLLTSEPLLGTQTKETFVVWKNKKLLLFFGEHH